jgi:hypothetical protein
VINLTAYEKITKAQNEFSMIRLTNLVALGNIVKAGEIDTTVISDNGTYIEVNKALDTSLFVGRYAVVGREIVKITSITNNSTTSNVYVNRAQYGTLNSYEFRNSGYDMELQVNYPFRTVTIFDTLDWTLNTSSGNNSDPFSFQLESGTVSISVDSYKSWNRVVTDRTYNLIPKSSCVYIFLGLNGQRMLNYTGFIKRWYFSTSKDGGGKLSIKFNDKFVKWYTTDMDKVFTINNVNPTQFFSAVLDIPSNMVRYDNGLSSDDFYTVSGVYSKEYTTYADLLSTYYKHAIRFNFDELERIRVFSDLVGSKVQPVTDVVITETNQLDIGQDTENALIINKVTSSYEERKTMYSFDDELNGRAKDYLYNTTGVLYTMLTGDDDFNTLTISNEQLYRRTLIGDYVLFKDESNGMQFYARVMDKKSNYTSELMLGRFDKDYNLLPRGKYAYLQSLGYSLERSFALYYGINELPTIFALTLYNSSGTEVTNNLQYPLLPQVVGLDDAYIDWECSFGSAEDLQIGSYSGYYENITSIYGTFDKTKLLYNREYTQLGDGSYYPYICALSTTTSTRAGTDSDAYLSFTTFDNTNLEVNIYESDSTDTDIVLKCRNTKSITSSNLHTETPAYISSKLLQVNSLSNYSVGDVLVINKPTSMTTSEYELYYSNKNTRYTIQTCFEESGNYYIVIDNAYPWSSTMSYVFSFTRFMSTDIVYLNELYLKGNPVISLTTTVETEDSSSIDLYEEQTYEIDGRFYCNNSTYLKNALQYFIDNFASIKSDSSDFRQIYSVKLRDKYEIQKGDVIRLRDNIYTGIDDTQYYYVLGCNYSAKTPEVTYDIIQVSQTDADGSDIEFTDQLEYTAVTTVNYVYTDSTADVGSSYVSDTDADLGAITLTRVSRSNFTADISIYGDNYITFSNLSGTYLSDYTDIFFGDGTEYCVLIDSEYIYVKWSNDYKVSIIKRSLFGTTETNITTSSKVTFYSITSGVTVSGGLTSTTMKVGSSSEYIRFTPLYGLEVKTAGEVTIENDNNRLYFDPSSVDNKSQILLAVDWKDTDGTVKVEYDGVEFQVGETTSENGYFKYNDSDGLSMNVKSLEIDGIGVQKVFNRVEIPNSMSTVRKETSLGINVDGILYTIDKNQYILKDFTVWGSNATSHSVNNSIIGMCSDGTYIYTAYVNYSLNNYNLYINRHTILDSALAVPTIIKSYEPYQSSSINILPDSFEMFISHGNKIVFQGYTIQSGNLFWFCETLSIGSYTSNTLYYSDVSSDTNQRYYILNIRNNYYSSSIFYGDLWYKYIQSGNLHYVTTSPSGNTIVLSGLEIYNNISMVGNYLFLYSNSYKKIYQITGDNAVLILDYSDNTYGFFIGKTSSFYYFKSSDVFYRTKDFITFEPIISSSFYSNILTFDKVTDILEFVYNSYDSKTKCYKIIGYSFGSSDI